MSLKKIAIDEQSQPFRLIHIVSLKSRNTTFDKGFVYSN